MNNAIFEDGDIEDLLNNPAEKKKMKPRSRKKTPIKKAVAKVSKKAEAAPIPAAPIMPVAPVAPQLNANEKVRRYKPGETKVITIQKERGVGGDRPVAVCYNGKQFTVPRGVRVEVPAPVAEILMNAEETIMEWVPDKNMIESRSAASYPTAIHD